MRPPRKKPQRATNGPLTWSHEKLKGGGSYNGWLAGKCEWVLVHHVGNSKPCYDELTDGKLPCPFCKPRCRREWLGYVPVYNVGGKRMLAVVKEYAETTIDRIAVYSPVRVSRGPEHHDPMCVEPARWTADPYKRLTSGDQGADIFAALLVIWQQPALTDHFADASDTTVSEPPPVVPPPPEDVPEEILKRSRLYPKPTAGQLESAIDTAMSPLTYQGNPVVRGKPSANGKHPPPAGD